MTADRTVRGVFRRAENSLRHMGSVPVEETTARRAQGGWASPETATALLQRRGGDSNPRYGYPHTGFRNQLHQPLGHLSGVGGAIGGRAGDRTGEYIAKAGGAEVWNGRRDGQGAVGRRCGYARDGRDGSLPAQRVVDLQADNLSEPGQNCRLWSSGCDLRGPAASRWWSRACL